jgi:hypothetical protein
MNATWQEAWNSSPIGKLLPRHRAPLTECSEGKRWSTCELPSSFNNTTP